MKGVPQVGIMDAPHPHDNIAYLPTVAVGGGRGGETGVETMGKGRERKGMKKRGKLSQCVLWGLFGLHDAQLHHLIL